MTVAPTYRSIKRQLRRQIADHYPPGTRLPPIKELARQMGTGQVNTQRAIQELSREGVVVSRPRMGTFVSPNLDRTVLVTSDAIDEVAKCESVLTGKTIHVTYSGPDPVDFQREMLDAFAEQIQQYGAEVTLGRQKWTMPLTSHSLSAAAIVALNPSTHHPIRFKSGQPFLALSTTAEVSIDMPGGFDLVTVDEFRGGFLAGWTMKESGCGDVCLLGVYDDKNPNQPDAGTLVRFNGFVRGWGDALPQNPLLGMAYDLQTGAELADRYLQLPDPPSAVFATSDELAVGFAMGMRGAGKIAGEDYQLMGFDGQRIARKLRPHPMTTIAVPVEEIGRRGAELLAHRIVNPEQPARTLRLGCSLFQGATVRNINPSEGD